MSPLVEWFKDKFADKQEENRQRRIDELKKARQMSETGQYSQKQLDDILQDITENIKKNAG